ncbi:unnamed protein product, partial [Prorocentrum cordatum]
MFGGGGVPGGGGQQPPFMMFNPGVQFGAGGGQGGDMGGMPFNLPAFFANAQFNGMGFPGQGFPFEQPQEQQADKRHHPTAASTLRTLPRVKVTAHDLAANEGTECSICLDELVLGESALRIPCGHLFHEECVK